MRTVDLRVRKVTDGDLLIAQVFNVSQPGPVIFPTPDSAEMQCGFGWVDSERLVPPHVHNRIPRQTHNTSEFIYVIDGSMDVVFLNPEGAVVDRAHVGSRQGFLQFVGGHKITIAAGTNYLELKQGPYFSHKKDKTILSSDPSL